MEGEYEWSISGTYSRRSYEMVRESLEAQQRDGVIRPDTGTRQRLEIEEVAGGVEAPADVRKGPSPKARLSDLGGTSMKESPAYKEPSPAAKGRPVLMLVEGSRGMRSASSRNGALPAPALRSPMLLVVGGHGHASTG